MRPCGQSTSRRRCRAALWALVAAPLLVAACSSYVSTSAQLRPLLAARRYDQALTQVAALDNGTSRLLYLYERGLVLHQSDRFEASNAALDSAEVVYEDLYTRSISREAGALLVSETVREYRGERFEAAMLHYYEIMNYLAMGKIEAAAVQSRRLNHRLQVFKDTGNSVYTEDPFLQYLTGMVFTRSGDANDADVALRNALAAYRSRGADAAVELPGRLFCDLGDNAGRLGDHDAAQQYRADGECPPPAPHTSTLRLFLECGSVAYRDKDDIVLPIFKNEIHDNLDQAAYARTLASRWNQPVPSHVEVEYWLRISLPKLVETPSGIRYARITASVPGDTACATVTSVLGTNCTQLAQKAFAAEQGTILLRAVVRGLAKYLAKREAEKKEGETAGFLVNLLGAATETADTRCWSTLPEKILVAALDLPPGRYRLRVKLFDRAGREADAFDIPDVEVADGRESFLNYRIY